MCDLGSKIKITLLKTFQKNQEIKFAINKILRIRVEKESFNKK